MLFYIYESVIILKQYLFQKEGFEQAVEREIAYDISFNVIIFVL